MTNPFKKKTKVPAKVNPLSKLFEQLRQKMSPTMLRMLDHPPDYMLVLEIAKKDLRKAQWELLRTYLVIQLSKSSYYSIEALRDILNDNYE